MRLGGAAARLVERLELLQALGLVLNDGRLRALAPLHVLLHLPQLLQLRGRACQLPRRPCFKGQGLGLGQGGFISRSWQGYNPLGEQRLPVAQLPAQASKLDIAAHA